MGEHSLVKIQRSAKVDRDDLVPELRLGFQERLRDVPPRVVDEDIYPAELGKAALDGFLDLGIVGDVRGKGKQPCPVHTQLGAECVQCVRVDVDRDDIDFLV